MGISARKGQLVRNAALLIPLLELSLGLVVISGFWPILANASVLLLMLVFNSVILFALRKAPNAICQCFGALSRTRFSRNLFLRSAALTVLAILVLLSSIISPSLQEVPLWLVPVLIAEFLVLAVIAVHAVRVVEAIKERMTS